MTMNVEINITMVLGRPSATLRHEGLEELPPRRRAEVLAHGLCLLAHVAIDQGVADLTGEAVARKAEHAIL